MDGSERIDIGGVSVPCGHLIGGERVGSPDGYEVITPIDGSPLGHIPAGGPAEAAAAVAAATAAFPAWAALGPDGRGEVLDRFADAIVERMADFQRVDTHDHGALAAGRPHHGMPRTAWNVKFFSDRARGLHHDTIAGDVVDNSVRYDPSGVSALIVPWNAPLMLGTWKIGPALAVDELVVGDPRRPETRVGPLIHPSHFAKVQGLVERAVAGGARVLCGGGPHPDGGLYFQPTILAGVDQRSEIVQTEVFGPVLTLQTWRTEDELISLANDTIYGLAATLFSGDADRAERISSQLVAGTVWVNCFYVRDLAAPFGGSRASGIGREGGTWSFDFFCDVKNIATRRGTFAS